METIVRGPWLYVALVISLILAPLSFYRVAEIGGVALIIGLIYRRSPVVGVGCGLVLGQVPYLVAGLLTGNPS